MKKTASTSNRLITRLGKVTSTTTHAQGLSAETENGALEIFFWSESCVRVRMRRTHEAWEPFSYAVSGEPDASVTPTIINGDDVVIVEGQNITAVLAKANAALSFLDKDGKVLMGDDPDFGLHWNNNEVSHFRKLQDGERFIGLGEKTGALDRRGASYTNWNTDNFAYAPEADPLYLSTPFFIGLVNQSVYGYFLDNSFKTIFNFGASSDRYAWTTADGGILDYYFFHGPDVASVIQSYAQLTGFMPLPPKWSLGYQQCRYSYYPAAEVLSVAKTFREKAIPGDVIYLDIHYMDEYKVFTWHPKRFPDPKGMIKALKELGFRVAIIVDPGVKVEKGYAAYESGLAEEIFATYPDGSTYQGQVWPGWSHFPDFSTPEGRDWWADQFSVYTDAGVEGFWNDMNEPAAWGQHLPNAVEFGWEGHGATHRQARNVYGMQMVRATRAGVEARQPGQRPFLLTRAGFSGVQRYSAVWTGDNVATESHMLAGVRLVNSLGLTGIPFAGYDVGGFVGEASPALYARWMAIGAFTPFFRGHTMINSRDSEPWAYGEEVEDISRNYIGLRYQLMPYLYSAFAEAARSGMPIARSLAIDYSFHPEVYDPQFQNQYLFGPSILVAPSETTKDLLKVWLPPGDWQHLLTGEAFAGGRIHIVEQTMDKLPVFVRAGALITAQRLVQHLGESAGDTLILHVYAAPGGIEPVDVEFQTEYYEDDGESLAHENGAYYRRQLIHDTIAREVVLSAVEGSFASGFSKLRVVLHGAGEVRARVNGQTVAHELIDHRWMEPVSRFDPFSTGGPVYEERGLPCFELPLEAGVITLQY